MRCHKIKDHFASVMISAVVVIICHGCSTSAPVLCGEEIDQLKLSCTDSGTGEKFSFHTVLVPADTSDDKPLGESTRISYRLCCALRSKKAIIGSGTACINVFDAKGKCIETRKVNLGKMLPD